ncbi:hypothetical protein ABEF95_006512 [Exophiala dermatitidis]
MPVEAANRTANIGVRRRPMRVLTRLSSEALNRLPRERESTFTWLRTDSVVDKFLRNPNKVTHCQLAPNANGQAEAEAMAKLLQQLELYMDSMTDWDVFFADLVGTSNGNGRESGRAPHVNCDDDDDGGPLMARNVDVETKLSKLSLLPDAEKLQDVRCIGWCLMEWSDPRL